MTLRIGMEMASSTPSVNQYGAYLRDGASRRFMAALGHESDMEAVSPYGFPPGSEPEIFESRFALRSVFRFPIQKGHNQSSSI